MSRLIKLACAAFLVFLLFVIGLRVYVIKIQKDYRERLVFLSADKQVSEKIREWSEAEVPKRFPHNDDRFLLGGYLDGTLHANFDWAILGFRPNGSKIRFILDADTQHITAILFAEDLAFRRAGLLLIRDDKKLSSRLREKLLYASSDIAVLVDY